MQSLNDIRVLGVTVYLAGPFLGMTLARFGAEVIKIEMPGAGDVMRGMGPYADPEGVRAERKSGNDISSKFLKRSQGVKSITLNLKDPEGRQMFLELAKQSDVIIENLSPGSMKKMGLGFDDVAKVNPGIVYCSISGYGQEGAYANNPAHDHQIQAMGGLMDVNGHPDGPPTRVGAYISDLVTPLYAALSIMNALRHRDHTGKGQYLDASMMDTIATLLFMETLEENVAAGTPLRAGNNSRYSPTGLYHAIDGDVFITVNDNGRWSRLCRGLDATDLIDDPRFKEPSDREANLEVLREELQQRFRQYTQEDAVRRLEEVDIPVAPVRTLSQVVDDEHYYRRGTFKPMRYSGFDGAVRGSFVAGFPVLFSGDALPDLAPAPTLGMHNEDIYGKLLGLSNDALGELSRKGII